MNAFVALRVGEPLSVTTTVIVLVLGPWASVGVQVIRPLAGLMVMPIGGERRLKVRMLGGRSGSVAEADTDKVVNSSIVWFTGTVRLGGLFTSFTVTMKVFVALSGGEPLSVTVTAIVLTLGPCPSVGVQLIAPVSALIVMPAGGEIRLKERLCAGMSESEAEAETDSVVSSSIVWFEGTVSTGGLFTSVTVTIKLFVALSAGMPLSVTMVVITLRTRPLLLSGSPRDHPTCVDLRTCWSVYQSVGQNVCRVVRRSIGNNQGC